MNQIAIDVVLNKINDTVDVDSSTVKSYGLRFITAEGDARQIICRKHTKDATKKMDSGQPRGKEFFNLQRNGLILLDDLEAGHPKAVKVAMIYGFQDFQSDVWINVFH